MEITQLFKIHVARSHSFQDYEKGEAAFVTNGFENKGIQGFVNPLSGDRVFRFLGLCISAFCEATVQEPPFIGRGNGGSGVVVLEPLSPMTNDSLLFYASHINKCVRWRFSYGRMVSQVRIAKLDLPELKKAVSQPHVHCFLPERQRYERMQAKIQYGQIPIDSIFELHSGDYHNSTDLPEGNVPLVSCGDMNNGVVKFVSVPPEHIYKNTLTIAYNGRPLTSKYHPYRFAAKDDVAVCLARHPLQPSTMIYIQFLMNTEKWRFSYGRKCFREKLQKMLLHVPVDSSGQINEPQIKSILSTTSYWAFLSSTIKKSINLIPNIVDS